MGFPRRMKLHDEILAHLKKLLPENGFPCASFGIESGDALRIHKSLRYLYEDFTARFAKHQPDLIFVKEEHAYFIDVKTLTRYGTGNFSCELDSYKVLMGLVGIGCKAIVIYNTIPDFPYDLNACFVDEIKFWYTDERPSLNVKGSRTAYGLFSQIDPYIKPFEQFMEEL